MSVGHILALIVFLGVLLSFVVPLPEVAIRLFIGMLAAALLFHHVIVFRRDGV
jgi:membrane protein DedA with SNARE-associated domain